MKKWMIVALVAAIGLAIWWFFIRTKPETIMQAPKIVTQVQTMPVAPTGAVMAFDSVGTPYITGSTTAAKSGRGHF